jgi:hypothetical protein
MLQTGWIQLLSEDWEPMLLQLCQFPVCNVVCCQRNSAAQYISVQKIFLYLYSKEKKFNSKLKNVQSFYLDPSTGHSMVNSGT